MIGLRVDVDTRRGMERGVPGLLDVLRRTGARGTFFLTFGPDNMGKAIFSVLRRPGFFRKMVRTRAPSMYGISTILSGTLLPPRPVAADFPDLCRRIVAEGHEVAVHAWDHRMWQDELPRMAVSQIEGQLDLAFAAFRRIFGRACAAFAAPGWSATPAALRLLGSLPLEYTSNSRGCAGPFLPVVFGEVLPVPDIPVTLPTLDERLGVDGEDVPGFHEFVLREMVARRDHVYTVHAEVEGMSAAAHFEGLVTRAGAERFVPLAEVLADAARSGPLPECRIGIGTLPGRAGPIVMRAPHEP